MHRALSYERQYPPAKKPLDDDNNDVTSTGGAEVRGANVLHSAAATSVPFASVEGHQLCCREPGYQDLLAQRRPIVQSNCHTA